MCGIVCVSGWKEAEKLLFEGLKRLEYRGYDSAGLAVQMSDGRINCRRAVGKVRELQRVLDSSVSGQTGISHTRWATHGAPSEVNAHPQVAGRVALVHNGIIENFTSLRKEVEGAGRDLVSETDTEVVAQLLDMALSEGMSPKDALLSVVRRLQGAFAIAAIIEGEPDLVLAAKQGAPLLAALAGSASFVASDVMAFAGEAEKVIYLEDGDLVLARLGEVEVFKASGELVTRPSASAPKSAALAERGNHRHFMQKEIYEQPEVIGRTLSTYIDAAANRIRQRDGVDFSSASRLLIIGCGTAAFAGRVAQYWFEATGGLPTHVDIASEFRYRNPAFMEGDIALFISQSGETADTLEAMRMCKASGVPTLALVNTAHSSMAREADLVAPTLAGPEIGVASTKAFSCQLSALAALAVQAGVQRGRINLLQEQREVAKLLALPGLMSAALSIERPVDRLAQRLAQAPIVLYIGRNEYFPIALEGALKLKEISYIHAEGFAAGELKHGPIALVEEGVAVVVIAPHDHLFEKTRSSIEQVKARGATVIAITDSVGAEALGKDADTVLALPAVSGLAGPIVATVAVQLLAYYVAVHKGTDVDQPRNLAKSVTVE